MKLERWLLNVWYGNDRLGKYLLLPLTGIFCVLAAVQRWRHKRQQVKHLVPVIVVGNISVGGTGKTPLVIWLVERLREMGFKPGVVSRGYKGNVDDIGDEPRLIIQRTNVPLAVDRDRNQAIRQLLKTPIPNPSPARGEGSRIGEDSTSCSFPPCGGRLGRGDSSAEP